MIESVNYEELLSGKGIKHIHELIKKKKGYESSMPDAQVDGNDPSAIFGSWETDEACRQTFKLFSRFYGRCAKNLVLESLAWGGLYIGGGIAAKNPMLFELDCFLEEFLKSDFKRHILDETPIYLIKDYNVSLLGAAYAGNVSYKK